MRPATSVRRMALTLIGVLFAGAAITGGAVYAAQAAPDFTVSISPASQSVAQGQTASYTVTVTALNGFSGSVALTVSDVPANAKATITSSVSVKPTTPGKATLSVVTTSSTAVASYTFKVIASSGKLQRFATGGLTVTAPVTSSFTLSASPSAVTVSQGSAAATTVSLSRTRYTADVALGISGPLPAGVTATFVPVVLSGGAKTSTLTLTASTSAATGTSTVRIVGSSGGKYAYTAVSLTVITPGKPFAIATSTAMPIGLLSPGVRRPVDLVLTNQNSTPLSVTNLTVAITGTNSSGCVAKDNYTVAQYSGSYPLTVPANGSVSLDGLNVSPQYWPSLFMLNLTTSQDGCKSAVLTLAYSGSAQGN